MSQLPSSHFQGKNTFVEWCVPLLYLFQGVIHMIDSFLFYFLIFHHNSDGCPIGDCQYKTSLLIGFINKGVLPIYLLIE